MAPAANTRSNFVKVYGQRPHASPNLRGAWDGGGGLVSTPQYTLQVNTVLWERVSLAGVGTGGT